MLAERCRLCQFLRRKTAPARLNSWTPNDIRQADDQWIPRGFMWYILMERLPGINPELPFQREMDRAERDALRAAFKVAWL
jgi:hypothetical protein